jgi:hypothetical protein
MIFDYSAYSCEIKFTRGGNLETAHPNRPDFTSQCHFLRSLSFLSGNKSRSFNSLPPLIKQLSKIFVPNLVAYSPMLPSLSFPHILCNAPRLGKKCFPHRACDCCRCNKRNSITEKDRELRSLDHSRDDFVAFWIFENAPESAQRKNENPPSCLSFISVASQVCSRSHPLSYFLDEQTSDNSVRAFFPLDKALWLR